MKPVVFIRFILSLLLLGTTLGCKKDPDPEAKHFQNWSHYLGDPGRTHFSVLDDVSPENVTGLRIAWEFESPDAGQMQMNPIIIDSVLYGITAKMRPFALNARTGEQLWIFGDSLDEWYATSRGVSYWEQKDDKRVFYTIGSHLWALDALSGKPVTSFGAEGKIDLRSGLPVSARDKFVTSSTPGTIFKNTIIMPTRVSEGEGAAPGDIMAFDVRSGALKWVFHTIPYPGETGYDSWEDPDTHQNKLVGGANNWAGMSLDEANEILFVPTGSASPDFFGGVRKGKNLFSNCLLALNANTGERLWHFQFTHHDLWDRDPPAPPNLLSLKRNGEEISAVAQVTKQGYVFVFDRLSGQPLFEIEERQVPSSSLRGEEAWATQPIPLKPAPFARQSFELTEADLSPYAPNKEEILELFRGSDIRQYAPPSLQPVLLLPGYDGGAEWGGAAADPEAGILYVNSNEMPWFLQMSPVATSAAASPGEEIYERHCAVCHQSNRSGFPESGYPALTGLKMRKTAEEVSLLIKQGKGMMPGFPQLKEDEEIALLAFLFEQEGKQGLSSIQNTVDNSLKTPYKHKGYHKFLDSNGLPAIAPPWGSLHAIDLSTGNYKWSVVLGDTPSLAAKGHPQTGCENYGGPAITQNGLLFIAATKDGFFRAYNRHTGQLLWEFKLPAPAFATPSIYEVGGKEFIALACGGEKLGTLKGNKIIAFSLLSDE